MADLQKVADELEIRNIIGRLAQLADGGDPDEYVSLFTADGIWEMKPSPGNAGFPARTGRADIKAGVLERRANKVQGPGTHTMHVLTTTVVTLNGDKARVTSYMTFLKDTSSNPQVAIAAFYEDQFVREKDGWRIARRTISQI